MKTALVILILALTSTATAQNRLPNKPYTEWNLKEVTQLLFSSEWAQISSKSRPGTYNAGVPDSPPPTNFFVQLRLYSALPVRQAIVRRMQLTIPYAKLNDTQRASFDAEVDGLLKCPQCAEYYIVTLSSSREDRLSLATRGAPVTLDTVETLKRLPEDELLRHTWLSNDKGERRNAARVIFTPRHETILLFHRLDDHGNPLITPANKKFSIEFDDYLSKKTEEALKKFTFNVSDIVRNGEILF